MKTKLLLALCVALILCETASAGFISRIRDRRAARNQMTSQSCASGSCGVAAVQAAPASQSYQFGYSQPYQFSTGNCANGSCGIPAQPRTFSLPTIVK